MVSILDFICMLIWFVSLVFIILANTGYPNLNPVDFTEGTAYLVCFLHYIAKLMEDLSYD